MWLVEAVVVEVVVVIVVDVFVDFLFNSSASFQHRREGATLFEVKVAGWSLKVDLDDWR